MGVFNNMSNMDDFASLEAAGMEALRGKDYMRAKEHFLSALEIQGDFDTRYGLESALYHLGEYRPAFEQLRKLSAERPGNQVIFIRMARLAWLLGDYEAMRDAYERALLIGKNK